MVSTDSALHSERSCCHDHRRSEINIMITAQPMDKWFVRSNFPVAVDANVIKALRQNWMCRRPENEAMLIILCAHII